MGKCLQKKTENKKTEKKILVSREAPDSLGASKKQLL